MLAGLLLRRRTPSSPVAPVGGDDAPKRPWIVYEDGPRKRSAGEILRNLVERTLVERSIPPPVAREVVASLSPGTLVEIVDFDGAIDEEALAIVLVIALLW